MSTQKSISTTRQQDLPPAAAERPQVRLSSRRWSTGHSHPQLVTFSWGAVTPSATRR